MHGARWALWSMLIAGTVHAANIRMELRVDVTMGDPITVVIGATNSGDEPAHALSAEALLAGTTRTTEVLDVLPPAASHEWTLTLPPLVTRGTHPLPVRLRYADANRYELSAMLVHLVGTPGAPASPVHPALELGRVGAFGSGTFRLENPTPRAIPGRVVLLLPSEFVSEPPSQVVEIPAGSTLDVPVSLRNHRAILGSIYPAFAIFEHEADGVHYTVVAGSQLAVEFDEESPAGGWLILATIGSTLVVLALVAWRYGGADRSAAGGGSRPHDRI